MADLGRLLKPASLVRMVLIYLALMGLFAYEVRPPGSGWDQWLLVTVGMTAVMTAATVAVVFALLVASRGGLTAWQAGRMRAAGQTADALTRYNQALAGHPNGAEALVSRAEILAATGQAPAALADLDRAIAVTPHISNFPDPVLYRAYLERGRLREGLGDVAGALGDWRQAGRAAPDAPDPYILRGRAALEQGDVFAGRNEIATGVGMLTRTLGPGGGPQGGPTTPERSQAAAILNMRGLAYTLLGEHHRALADLEKSLELQPESWTTHYNLGATYVNLGYADQALAELKAAIALNPAARAAARTSRAYAPLRENDEFVNL
ncbi:MAG TPA: tetratricopeptide repeat protein, partial [Chloroflexia bacterium]|nr:tetratricopeptide repeat protein [Chloroflexia bacterium]